MSDSSKSEDNLNISLEERLVNKFLGTDDPPSRTRLHGEMLLTHLLAVNREMAEMRTIEPLLSYILDSVLDLVGAELGYISLIRDDGSFEYKVKRAVEKITPDEETFAMSKSVIDEVVTTRQPLILRNASMDPRFGDAKSVLALQLRSIMCAPLITKNKLIGTIYVENRNRSGRFSDSDLLPLEFFSNQAAVAIENAHINENLERLVDERTQELAEARDVAEAANRAKSRFLSNMSHELRTPLNAIINLTGFVVDDYYGEINGDQRRTLEQVLRSSSHLLGLINDLMDLNKIESGIVSPNPQPVSLEKLFSQLLFTAESLVNEKPIELISDYPDALPIVMLDQRMLWQILLNVTSNAVKYTLEGSIRFNVELNQETFDISISDTGIGISEDDAPYVFDYLKQGQDRPDDVVSSGLGMYITKQLVELNGGSIWFESKVGSGTTFFIRMPISANASS